MENLNEREKRMDIDERMHAEVKGNEAIFTRTISARRDLVYKAWTNSYLFSQWWGPHGFYNRDCQTDVKPGGQYKLVMCAPDGLEYPIKGSYLELKENQRLSFTLSSGDQPDEWQELLARYRITRSSESDSKVKLIITVLFEEIEDKTALSIVLLFGSEAECNAMMEMGAAEGWAQSLERLEDLLNYMS